MALEGDLVKSTTAHADRRDTAASNPNRAADPRLLRMRYDPTNVDDTISTKASRST
jgi:hypothetical protein